jgi:hypothetical protein
MQCKTDILQICNILFMHETSGGKMRREMFQTVRNRDDKLQVVAAPYWSVTYVFPVLMSCLSLGVLFRCLINSIL